MKREGNVFTVRIYCKRILLFFFSGPHLIVLLPLLLPAQARAEEWAEPKQAGAISLMMDSSALRPRFEGYLKTVI